MKSESEEGGVASLDEGVGPDGGGMAPSSGGAGPDANTAALWECYFKWAVERHQQPTSFKSVRKKVSLNCSKLNEATPLFRTFDWS